LQEDRENFTLTSFIMYTLYLELLQIFLNNASISEYIALNITITGE
jgi:hypothetical protein